MHVVFDILKNCGLKDHWLTKEMLVTFEKHSSETSGGVRVPTKEFFETRSQRLRELAKKLLAMQYGQKEVTVPVLQL